MSALIQRHKLVRKYNLPVGTDEYDFEIVASSFYLLVCFNQVRREGSTWWTLQPDE